MWPYTLSGRLSIVGLVGFYPANYLMDRRLIPGRYNCTFHHWSLPNGFMRYYPVFPRAIPHPEADHLRVTHPFATLGQVLLPALPSDLHA